MYLKNLELLGFKSFAPRTVLNFHRGVTAIVGPNGCGKSNVLDAIRWVLGEQSAKALRGGEMADVIFNGSDSRKPLGMAEVSMTFSECEEQLGVEWNEVRITRRVYRDGKSEYLLNKAPCRLKDIHNLFMDTGIGRTAYSIMEQGKIDLILSSRPDDRRAIFEEAAGITKYKSQKKEALRKLEYTDANLLRVTDIIKEVKRQIGSLQRQAGKARRYQALIVDLKILDTHFSKHRFDAFDKELREITEKIESLRSSHSGLEEKIEATEVTLREHRQEVEVIETEITNARQKVQELVHKISNARHRIEFNDERTQEYQSLIERYEKDIAGSEEKRLIQQDQITETDQQLDTLTQTLETEKSQLDAEIARAEEIKSKRSEAQSRLQSLTAQVSNKDNRQIKARAQLESLQHQREGNESRLQVLANDIAQLAETAERLTLQSEQSGSRLEESQSNLESKRNALNEAEALLTSTRQKVDSLNSELTGHHRELTGKDSRLQVLRQLVQDGEGFEKGAQAVLKGLDRPDFFKPATIGALATLIEVEPKFIPAVEAALGQNLQSIIVNDIDIAEQAINALAQGKSGRASLTAPDIMPRPSATQMETLPDGAISWAIDKVTTKDNIRSLVTTLLNGVIIVEDLATALELKSQFTDLAFATLTGETITREGIIHGGQASSSGGSVLQRKAQIKELEKEINDLQRNIDRLSDEKESAEASLTDQKNSTESLREEVQEAKVLTSTLEGQVALMERELRETNGRLDSVRWENQNLNENISASKTQSTDLQEEIENLGQEADALRGEIEDHQAEIERLRTDEDSMTSTLEELRIKVASNRQSHESLTRQRQPMGVRLQELNDLLQQRQADISGYTTKIEDLHNNSETLNEEIKAATEEKKLAEEAVEAVVNKRLEVQQLVGEVEGQLREFRREMNAAQESRSKLDVRQTQIQLRIESLCENITRRYHLELQEFQPNTEKLLASIDEQQKRHNRQRKPAATEVAEAENESSALTEPEHETPMVESVSEPDTETTSNEIDWDTVEEMVKELTDKVDSMGPVNIDAIQEFDELEERHKFLEEQFEDLTNSKEELLGVIQKINTTTKKLFAETFEQVRLNFQTMFVELFGGGKADLMLSDASDPLESGVEIIAKPPGKQLTSIALLSGGEKTMTAVALLFSIYMVKPSPFCVLDEMDAPLDESNISRFIKILNRFVEQSQFVVITHNKRTISRADILYGVTMEEHGVSKLVGVKLAQDSGENPNQIVDDEKSISDSFGKSDKLHSETVPA